VFARIVCIPGTVHDSGTVHDCRAHGRVIGRTVHVEHATRRHGETRRPHPQNLNVRQLKFDVANERFILGVFNPRPVETVGVPPAMGDAVVRVDTSQFRRKRVGGDGPRELHRGFGGRDGDRNRRVRFGRFPCTSRRSRRRRFRVCHDVIQSFERYRD